MKYDKGQVKSFPFRNIILSLFVIQYIYLFPIGWYNKSSSKTAKACMDGYYQADCMYTLTLK